MVIEAEYISVWDGGAAEVRSACRVDLTTRQVFDIEVVDVDNLDLSCCDEEFVQVAGRQYPVENDDHQIMIAEDMRR